MKKHFPFWISVVAIIIILLLPRLIQDGMFNDGMNYATIAHNLSNGIGSFWFPCYTKTVFTFYQQQPPLTFGIMSLFYDLFGSSMYVERFYSFLTACISAYIIVLIWRQMFRNNIELKRFSWLPVLFWIIIPVCFWSYSANMEENTMGIFVLLSVLFTIKGFDYSKYLYLVFAGISLFLAALCKGFPGLFPIVLPFLYYIINKNISLKKTLLYTITLITVPFVIYFLILQNSQIYLSLTTYLDERVFNSIKNVSTYDNRFYIIIALLKNLSPLIVIALLLKFIFRNKDDNSMNFNDNNKLAIIFILLAFAGTLPLMITMEQKQYYFVAALPYYGLGFAAFLIPIVSSLIGKIDINKKSFKIFRIISVALLIFALIYSASFYGKTGRDKEQLHDVYLIGKVLPKGITINTSETIYPDWSMHNYFMRYYFISLVVSDKENDYYLIEKNDSADSLTNYSKVDIPTVKYDLYFKQKEKLEKLR
jgi:4-amino-4-deoxy-L-arabinose transferase-like glycosyltransferase